MPAKKKTWREKLEESKDLPKVFKLEPAKSKWWGANTMVIPAPSEVDELMRRVPKGKLTTIDDLRKALAAKHRADIACPFTTGIFAWIAAHASAEAKNQKTATPFWRTLKTRGELNPKYPGGIASLKKKLKTEGHAVKQKGKRFFVDGFAASLAKIDRTP